MAFRASITVLTCGGALACAPWRPGGAASRRLSTGGTTMAVDTFIAYVGVYDKVSDADADYALVKDLHTKENLIDSYDAAVIQRRADGKVKITKKHETPTRVGGVLGGGVGLAPGLVVALFPIAALRRGPIALTHAG